MAGRATTGATGPAQRLTLGAVTLLVTATALPEPALAIGSAENEDGDVTIDAIGSSD
jgi:hypothetical protein